MKNRFAFLVVGFLMLSLLAYAQTAPAKAKTAATTDGAPNVQQLQKMMARFAPTEMKVDTSALSPGDKKALAKLVEAASVIDDIFLTQFWSGNQALYSKLKKDTTPLGKARLEYFWINKGPWSALDGQKAFLPGVPPEKLPGANFYPEGATKEEIENWIKTLPEGEQEQARSFFTVIRRAPMTDKSEHEMGSAPVRKLGGPAKMGGLKTVPFSDAYKHDLERAANLLRDAAELTDNASLKRFLTTRAAAFLSNDYYESDVAWMDLDAPLDITIGPYETYNDEMFGYKASYEAYVNLRDEKESGKLAAFSNHLQEVENNLPIDEQYRNPKIGSQAPIRVVNEVYAGGDGNHGVQTAAYNLPNDERVVQQKGSKRVMLKNVQEAKFNKTLVPISRQVLSKDEQNDLSFELFFTHILAHELSHGLGPHQITINGRKTTTREELKDLYSAMEEAKADALGLFSLQYMMDHAQQMGMDKVLPTGADAERKLYTTFLASCFRTLRFGLHEAHGKGMALQVNYLIDKGGFVVRPDGTFAVDFDKIKPAVRDLTHDLLMLEAKGDYAGSKKMLAELGVLRPDFQKALNSLTAIPTDIRPVFVTANELIGSGMAKPAKSAAGKK
ncbi:MAG TPA: hypothetical protein VN622_10325 [Clostridia bacterium]|nr:hypothetical protein [Clostridia bacterium]